MRAETYEDCRRVCPRCDIGLSNAPDQPTFIRRDWRDGLWRPRSAARLEAIVQRSLNEQTREKKLRRLANERSEDLLTWNVFSWLEERQLLGHVVRRIGHAEGATVTPQIFYWGANDRYELGLDLPGLLKQEFKERAASLSEPDVMLVGESALVLIEAKFDSPNDRQPGKEASKYINAASGWFRASAAEVAAAGYYELTRNWAIGGALAERLGKQFTLVNLLRRDEQGKVDVEFKPLLSDKGRFAVLNWEDLLETVEPALLLHLKDETLYFNPAFPSAGQSASGGG
ncbi:MAG: hypothetical protein HY703_06020 [Gemmatimonadetes bacterium]|nr:hypothetical protein [Gemmatimonadota bacterium]